MRAATCSSSTPLAKEGEVLNLHADVLPSDERVIHQVDTSVQIHPLYAAEYGSVEEYRQRVRGQQELVAPGRTFRAAEKGTVKEYRQRVRGQQQLTAPRKSTNRAGDANSPGRQHSGVGDNQSSPEMARHSVSTIVDPMNKAPTISPLGNLGYLFAAILFIFAIKGMTHPRTVVRGNLLGALGMFIAVIITFCHVGLLSFGLAAVGVAIGGVIGTIIALKEDLTQIPHSIAILGSLGALGTLLVAGVELLKRSASQSTGMTLAAVLAGVLGGSTFAGCLVAAGKLDELKVFRKPWNLRGLRIVKALLIVASLLLAILTLNGYVAFYLLLVLISIALGVLFVFPVRSTEMPVIVAILNSFSGLAVAALGFVLSNTVLIISGSLVASSGLVTSKIMCQATNCSVRELLSEMIFTTACGTKSISALNEQIPADGEASTSLREPS